MNINTLPACNVQEKRAVGLIENQNLIAVISKKSSEVNRMKRFLKDEGKELQDFSRKCLSLNEKLTAVQLTYKQNKSQANKSEDCVQEQQNKCREKDEEIILAQKQVSDLKVALEDKKFHQKANQDKSSNAKQRLMSTYTQLSRKLVEYKKEVYAEEDNKVVEHFNINGVKGKVHVVMAEVQALEGQVAAQETALADNSKSVHEIVQTNCCLYKSIKHFEELRLQQLQADIAVASSCQDLQRQEINQYEQKKQERLQENEESTNKLSQLRMKKSKLCNDLTSCLEKCKSLKCHSQAQQELEQKLSSKIECIKQENKRLLQILTTLKRQNTERDCEELEPTVVC